MPEYDAFGREIGDDPLAALRDATAVPREAGQAHEGGQTPAEATVAMAPEAVRPAPAPARSPVRPQFVRPQVRRRGGMASLLVLVAVIGALGLGGAFVSDRIEDLVTELPTVDEPEPAPAGLGQRSLIRRANFAAALAILRESGQGRPATLRVVADRIDATLAGPDGISQVQVTFDRTLRTLATTDAGATPPTTPYRLIDPAAPERLVRGADAAARRIDNVLLLPGRPVTWRAAFRDGTVVTGDAGGRPR